jgi:CheY-like chemotaxis protein
MSVERSFSRSEPGRFLGEIAHDLRNLLEGLEIALFRDEAPCADADTRDMMRRELYDLIRKIENERDRARLAAGRIELSPSAVHLASSWQAARDRLAPFLKKRSVRFRDEGGSCCASADPAIARKILENALHSAVRLTASGDTIGVAFRANQDHSLALVEIPSRSLSDGRIERLLSIEDESGIGLGVSRAFARLSGGELSWERGENDSIRFLLRLPVAVSAPSDATREAGKLSILVVDDNREAATSLSMLLSLSGHETDVRHDGRSALEAVRAHVPDVVLLDLGLPDIDGYEVCRAVCRDVADSARPSLVALSGRGDEEARRRSREAGFEAHLLKPVELKELQSVLRKR